MAEDEFPVPVRPNTLKEMVSQMKGNQRYAEFIHTKVSEARNGDPVAIAIVTAHFDPGISELTDLSLSTDQATALKRCTDPRTHLVDFIYYVAYPPP